MTEIKVEKGIPMPEPYTKYPWLNLEIGDSFAFPSSTSNPHTNVGQANKRYAPRKFKLAKLNGEWRCWRVE